MHQQCFKLLPGTEFFYNDPRNKNLEIKLHVPNCYGEYDPFIVTPQVETETRVYWNRQYNRAEQYSAAKIHLQKAS